MNFIELLLLLTFFLLIINLGYTFTRRILNENRLTYLIPLSVCFGSALFVILIHFCSFITGIQIATYTSLFLISAITLFIFVKYKTIHQIDLGLSKLQFTLLLSFSLFLTFLSLWHLSFFSTYDPIYQVIETIIEQGIYPPHHPYSPEAPFNYHYGVILFGAALRVFSNIEVWHSLIPIQVMFIFITPIVIFSFIFSHTKNFLQSFFGSIIGCFCANLTSLEIFIFPFVHKFSDFIQNFHKNLVPMNEGGFTVSTNKALISPNMSVAIPLSIILFYLCTNEVNKEKKYWLPILTISAFLFFSYESFWVPVILAILLFHLASSLQSKNKGNQLKPTLILITLLLISPMLVGGIFTNKESNISNLLYFDPKLYTFSWAGILNQFYPYEWFAKNEVISHGDGFRFYKVPLISKYFFIELGLPYILLPLIILWILFKRNLTLFSFLLSGLISFTLPFLISYIPRDIEVIRFFIYAKLVFSILFGIFLGYLLEIKLPFFIKIFSRTIIFILIITLTLPGIIWLLPIKFVDNDYRYTNIPKADKKALSWLNNHVKPGDRGLGPINVPHKHFELITVAGVYGIGIAKEACFEENTRYTALTTLNPCLLKELKVRWVYLNNDLLSKISPDVINKLIEEKILLLRYKNKDETRKIYEFNQNNIGNYCKNKNYLWALGKMNDGKFVQQTTFPSKDTALSALTKLKKELNNKESYWYRIEAIKI